MTRAPPSSSHLTYDAGVYVAGVLGMDCVSNTMIGPRAESFMRREQETDGSSYGYCSRTAPPAQPLWLRTVHRCSEETLVVRMGLTVGGLPTRGGTVDGWVPLRRGLSSTLPPRSLLAPMQLSLGSRVVVDGEHEAVVQMETAT